MIPDLLPYHSYDPDGQVLVQRDGSLGLAWSLSPLECDTLSENAQGQLARRIEALLALFPEGSAAQFLLTSDRRVDLDPWLAATSEDGLLRDLAESRIRATRTFEIPHEGSILAARRLGFTMTLRTFPRWHAPSMGDGLRYTFRGARTIEQKFLDSYAAEKRIFLERADAIESLLQQSAIRFHRMDVAAFRRLAFSLLNPDRRTAPPADDGTSLLEEGVAFTHAEIEAASVRLGSLSHQVLSVREVP